MEPGFKRCLLFFSFEGGEGCGKSTQSRALLRKLSDLAMPVILIREPGGTELGEKIRILLKQSSELRISALSELLLFNASRSQLVDDVITPALNEQKIVISDRFGDSTIAYQSFGRGLELETVKMINQVATHGLVPEMTFLLDVPPEIGLSRKHGSSNDRFEQENLTFHNKVRQGFLKLAAEEPQRWTIIDAMLPKNRIFSIIWNKVTAVLQARGNGWDNVPNT